MILMSSRIDILRNHVDEQDKRIEKLEIAVVRHRGAIDTLQGRVERITVLEEHIEKLWGAVIECADHIERLELAALLRK